MQFTIQNIYTDRQAIPLFQYTRDIKRDAPIWIFRDSSGETIDSCFPAAFKIDMGFPAKLIVGINVSGITSPCNVEIIASCSQAIKFKTKSPVKLLNNGLQRFELFASVPPVLEFSAISEKFKWQVQWKETDGTPRSLVIGETYLELYWLYSYNEWLFKKGVHVEILREVAKCLPGRSSTIPKTRIQPLDDPVIEAIVKSCFERNPPRYNDTSSFLNFNVFDEPMTFKLKEYFEVNGDETKVCSCYDLAALVQVYLKAIGLKNPRFCYAEPFGKLNSNQKLMGRGSCISSTGRVVNTSQMRNTSMDYDVANSCISEFGSHTFCCISSDLESVDPGNIYRCNTTTECHQCKVLDACIGPHIGNENIQNYLKKAITRPNKISITTYLGVTDII